MKKKILNIVLAAAVTPFLCCCTDNFGEYNTNPYEPHSLNPPMLFATMITTGINVQQNDNQMIDQMVAGPFSGYLTMANSWGGSNFNTFNQTESWNQIPFNTPFEKFYSNYFKLETATGGKRPLLGDGKTPSCEYNVACNRLLRSHSLQPGGQW